MNERARWLGARLRAMSVREVGHRLGRSVTQRLLARSRARPMPTPSDAFGFFLALTGEGVDPAPYRIAADRLVAGQMRVFALDDVPFPPEWNRDPKTGRLAPLLPGTRIDYRREQLVGDIKYLWEPNRQLELVTLAQAWRLTGERRYLDAIRDAIGSWLDQCPFPLGPNWTSSLELALRLVNWSLTWQLTGGHDGALFADAAGRALRGRWLDAIHRHLRFIRGHLSLHSSANNHLLGEYLGLLVGATSWCGWPEAAGWRRFAAAGFVTEALRQTAPDGVNREQAIYYQHEVMDMMLLAGLLARATGAAFGSAYWDRLERMCDFLAAAMDVAGTVPMIGDADDASILRLDPSPDACRYRSLLATGAVLFDRADLAVKAGALDDRTRWLLPGAALPAPVAAMPTTAFPEGGYYLLGRRLGRPDEVRLLCDCGPLGYLSLAAHGHADALAFTLSAGGREWLVDPGTYAYHTDKAWRDHFRGTGAHNTLRIDGQDQSVIGGNFLWTRKARARLLTHDPAAGRFAGEHDGYQRLHDPVTHRRAIAMSDNGRRIVVREEIACRSTHQVDLSFQFHEECTVTADPDGRSVTASRDGATLRLTCRHPGLTLALLRGETAPIAGWVSRRFDRKVPATMARWSGQVGASVIDSVITLDGASA